MPVSDGYEAVPTVVSMADVFVNNLGYFWNEKARKMNRFRSNVAPHLVFSSYCTQATNSRGCGCCEHY